MNKRQKEVLQYQLDSEKAVLEQLTKHYQRALNDIDMKIRILQSDELTQSRVYRIEYQKALKKQVEAILEKLHSDEYTTIQQFLSDSYTAGYVGTAYDMFGQGVPLILPVDKNAAVKAVVTDSQISEGLYESLGVDTKKLKKTISSEITRGIASGLPHSEIARNIAAYARAPLSRAKTIVRTEAHRISEASRHDAQVAAKGKGANVVKQWDSTLDGNTRKTHRKLDGQIREIDEPFEMDGKKAMYPGDFGDPAEDCNCRCIAVQRARIALDEDELKTLQERAKFFGLDKTDEFADFKKKYLKAAEKVDLPLENAGKSGIIKVAKASALFVGKDDPLYINAQRIKPIDGYDDFVCHATADTFLIYSGGEEIQMPAQEYAEHIKASSSFHNRPIRIISCQAGAKPDGVAKQLAMELGVNVLAPTEDVSVDEDGRMFVSNNDVLAELWNAAPDESKQYYKETGKWKEFEPGEG